MAPVYRIRHPFDPRLVARYGVDDDDCYWAEVTAGVVVDRYDVGSVTYDTDAPLSGLLMFLAHHGFVGADDVEAPLGWVDGREERWGWRTRPPGRIRRMIRIIANLTAAGG